MHGVPFERRAPARVGLIGAGGRGQFLLGELRACEGVQIAAVADAREEMIEALKPKLADDPPAYYAGANCGQKLLEHDLDLVIVATSWETHTPLALEVMEAGKHAAVEVPAAVTLEECWQLVETSERTRRHCIMLENCCYGYWEMLVKRMCAAGLLGSLTHAECAYIHNLRSYLLQYQQWRRQAHIRSNRNLYPTHGLGPVAQCFDIGGEDAFDYLVSMSSREAGLSEYRARHIPADDPRQQEGYVCGDMNVSLIRTRQGRTIVLQHDVVTPRPYDRIFLVSGTKGTFRDYPPRLYLDEASQSEEEWLNVDNYRAAWEDPLWKEQGEQAIRLGGHGGMDYLMLYRLMQTMHAGLPPEMDVYDAADWSAPGPLSEQSVARRSAAVDFPVFRR